MKLAQFIIYATGYFFLLYGIAYSFAPVFMAELITDSVPVGSSSLVDFRATYGGMTIAVGLTVLYLNAIKQRRASLVIVSMLLLFMALTRFVGLWIEGPVNNVMYLYLVLELLGGVLSLYALNVAEADSPHS